MGLTDDQRVGLGAALNEAAFVDVETSSIDDGVVVVTVRALSWDDVTDSPDYPLVHLSLSAVSRVAASLRLGSGGDPQAGVESFGIGDLSEVVREMGPSSLYGWEFVDVEIAYWQQLLARLSVDYRTTQSEPSHYLHLFKEEAHSTRTLDLRIWFEDLATVSEAGDHFKLEDFIQRGARWWDAVSSGDKRTADTGIISGAANCKPVGPGNTSGDIAPPGNTSA